MQPDDGDAHHAQQLLQLTRVVGPSWALFNSAFGLTSQGFAALLLQQVGGDSARYVATVSTVESASSGLMIFLSPHIGRAVDTVGRRPMMVWAHCAVAASHALVCAFPSLPTLILVRLVSYIATTGFRSASDAALADLCRPGTDDMAVASSAIQMYTGFGTLLSSPAGGYLTETGGGPGGSGPVASLLASLLVSACGAAVVQCSAALPLPPPTVAEVASCLAQQRAAAQSGDRSEGEPVPVQRIVSAGLSAVVTQTPSTTRKIPSSTTTNAGAGAGAVRPPEEKTTPKESAGFGGYRMPSVEFLRLFQSSSSPPGQGGAGGGVGGRHDPSRLRLLTIAYLLQITCDWTFIVDQVYFTQRVGMTGSQVGRFFALRGVCVLCGSAAVKPLLSSLGPRPYLLLVNAAAAAFLLAKSRARSFVGLVACLPLYSLSPMFVRTGPLAAMFMEEGIARQGIKAGELVGAFDSLKSLAIMIMPLVYSRLYGSVGPAAPYVLGVVQLVICQALVWVAERLPSSDSASDVDGGGGDHSVVAPACAAKQVRLPGSDRSGAGRISLKAVVRAQIWTHRMRRMLAASRPPGSF